MANHLSSISTSIRHHHSGKDILCNNNSLTRCTNRFPDSMRQAHHLCTEDHHSRNNSITEVASLVQTYLLHHHKLTCPIHFKQAILLSVLNNNSRNTTSRSHLNSSPSLHLKSLVTTP
jgi:hypothetical protein